MIRSDFRRLLFRIQNSETFIILLSVTVHSGSGNRTREGKFTTPGTHPADTILMPVQWLCDSQSITKYNVCVRTLSLSQLILNLFLPTQKFQSINISFKWNNNRKSLPRNNRRTDCLHFANKNVIELWQRTYLITFNLYLLKKKQITYFQLDVIYFVLISLDTT